MYIFFSRRVRSRSHVLFAVSLKHHSSQSACRSRLLLSTLLASSRCAMPICCACNRLFPSPIPFAVILDPCVNFIFLNCHTFCARVSLERSCNHLVIPCLLTWSTTKSITVSCTLFSLYTHSTFVSPLPLYSPTTAPAHIVSPKSFRVLRHRRRSICPNTAVFLACLVCRSSCAGKRSSPPSPAFLPVAVLLGESFPPWGRALLHSSTVLLRPRHRVAVGRPRRPWPP
jgi:hypothetical protein